MRNRTVSERIERLGASLLRYSQILWYYLRSTARKAVQEDILFLASGIAFNSILTLIPLLLLSASVLGALLNSSAEAMNRLHELLAAIFPAQPYAADIRDTILKVVSDIIAYRRSLGLFGAGVLVFTATSLFDSVRTVLHKVYRLERTRGLVISFVHDIGFVSLVFLLFVSLNFFTWVLSLGEHLALEIPQVAGLGLERVTRYMPTGVVLLVAALMYYVVYRFIPDTRPPKMAGIISTVTTSLLWVVSGRIFALYLAHFSAIGRIYGPYAFLLVLLFWVYYSSLVFVVGAMVGQVYWERMQMMPGKESTV
jgi:membrane protein